MNKRAFGWMTLGLAVLAALTPAVTEAGDATGPRKKILVLTHWTAFRHSSLQVAEKILPELGDRTQMFEAVCLAGHAQERGKSDVSQITPEFLRTFDAILFFTQGEPPFSEEQRAAILDFLKGGKGTIAVHCGTDSFRTWPDYGQFISGAYFKTHAPNDKPLILKVEDKNHPATRMLGDSFEFTDEFYQFTDESFSRDRVRVLFSVDTEKSDLAPQRMEKGKDYPLAWCSKYGEGRSFVTALGHRDDVWTNPLFQEHLLGGIKWALGLEEGDATPSGAKK